MKKGNFGETLRREREMRGVSLEEIADATRISTRFLLALENEQWEHLPGGVFNRGFVRSVARFLGLDEETLVAEYALATNDKPEVAVWATGPRPRSHIALWLTLTLLLALAVSGFFAWREAAPWLGPQIAQLWDRITSGSRATSQAAPNPAPAPEPASDTFAGERLPLLTLKLEAGESTLVTVVADGVTRFNGRIAKDEKKEFSASEKFEVTARDPFALVLTLNGQELPPLGVPGQPGSKTFTRADLNPQEGNH